MYWIILLFACVARAQNEIYVNTSQGVIVGSLVDGDYLAFYGIPYAGPTSGENRFKAPTPISAFPEEFHAIEKNVMCARPSTTGIIGIEDCLKLSIFTKNVTTPKPVFVWVQEEDFPTWNTAPYSFNEIVQSDLVFVTLNYRLSIFGFLCLGVPDAPGNAGLRDIVQGLKWIRENIAGFGGDPNNVVLFGHGSGAAMVDLITLSPLATGLVHKAITLSGSGLAPWAVAYDPIGHANAVADKLGYVGKNREELAKFLAATDLNVLGTVLNDFEFLNNSVLFAPCVENTELNPNDTILGDAPINLLRSGNYSDIPYIGGHTSREGTIRAEQAAFHNWLFKMQANFSNFIQVDFGFESAVNKTAVANSIREFHFPSGDINMQGIENFLEYIGNTTIAVATNRNVRERSLTSNSEVRFLEFAYRGEDPNWPLSQIPLTGAKHGAILYYLFGSFGGRYSDSLVQEILIELFTAFAYTGNPNSLEVSHAIWRPQPASLYIGGGVIRENFTYVSTDVRSVLKDEMDFWIDLYQKYYIAPKSPVSPPESPVSSAEQLLSVSLMLLFSSIIHMLF